jgi:predicted transcriptional regulator
VADPLQRILVGQIASRAIVALQAEDTLQQTLDWLHVVSRETTHQRFPVLDPAGHLVGVLTRRDLLDSSQSKVQALRELIRRPPKFVYDDCTVRQAVDHMLNHGIGRLPVVARDCPTEVIGMISRSDVLAALRPRVDEHQPQRPSLSIRLPKVRRDALPPDP